MTTTTTETATFNKRTYSSSAVRIGNWREDEALELVRSKDDGLFSFVCFVYSCRGILKIFSLSLTLSYKQQHSGDVSVHDSLSSSH